MSKVSTNLREELSPDIIKWANLESTVNDLLNNFESWEQRNAELVNRFFDQTYFRGEESLINKLIEVQPNIEFDDIKDEWINLALLLDNEWLWDFKSCLDKLSSNEIKEAFINEVFDRLNTTIGWTAPYTRFNNECDPHPFLPWWHMAWTNPNILWYFQKVVEYLDWKEWTAGARKTIDILKGMVITNDNLNTRLTTHIPTWVPLADPTIPTNIKDDFDTLLSFEIGQEADRTISIAKDYSKNIQSLLTNSIPAINTIVWQSDEYKFDESKLWFVYQRELKAINDNTTLSEEEKIKQINDLRWTYYIRYLKTKNIKIWNALEQLYNNNFDYKKVEPGVLKDYFDRVADIRLKMLFDKWTNKIIKLNWWDIDWFKNFYKQLTDVGNTTVKIPWPAWADVDITVHKNIVEWENGRLKDITQFWKNADQPFDAFPMEFTINKSDINRLPLSIEDRTKLLNLLSDFDKWDRYEIKWEHIWILIYLFFVINSRLPITEFDPEKQKEVEDLFWKAKNHKNMPDPNVNNNEAPEQFTPANFKEEIEKLWQWKFENWAEIYIPAWKSALPGWWYQWMKIKVSKIDMAAWTFVGTAYWWELKFNDKLEWKTETFQMDKETLNEFKKTAKKTSGSEDKVWLLPNPNKSDFNSHRENLNNKLWTSTFSFPINWVTRDGNKFMQKVVDEKWKEKEVEVKYFWASWDDTSTYKIEYSPIRRCFTVSSSFNWKEKWKDWKPKTERFSYKRDMDWNNFLIFYTQKWLCPQTEEEANDAIVRQDEEFKALNGWHWKLNWFSINNIKHWFKDIFSNLKKKLDDYNKRKDEEFRKLAERRFLNCLGAIPLLPPSIRTAIWERQQELYSEEFNEARTEIERYLKALQSDDQFADTFEWVPAHVQTLYWKSYKKFIEDLYNRKWSISTEEKRKAAALLLANIQKGWSPYRWLSGYENSGLWVKVILGNAHYQQFLRDKQKCINDLKNAWDEKEQLEDVLATCEMDYIMNNINWANWKLKYFGSHEKRGIPWKEGTDYIPNPSKRLLSEKFSKELKNSYKWWFDASAVNSAFNEIKHNDFNLAREDFKRFLKSWRFPQAISNLEKMFSLADNDEQKADYQKCFLIYMLSGILDFNGKKDLRKQAYQWAKTMSFLPGMLAKNVWHPQQVVTLLDDFCQEKWYWKFSETVKSYFHEWDLKKRDLKKWDPRINALIWDMDAWWNVDKMKKFEEYTKSTFPSKKFPEGSVLHELQKSALKTDMENIDNSLLENDVVANSGWLLSNANVVRDRMLIKDGEFEGKEPKEKDNRKKFWKQITDELKEMKMNHSGDPESVKLVLNQYFSRFWLNSEADRQKAYQWVRTAYEWKKHVWQRVEYDYTWKWKKEWYIDMGTISMKEIEDIIRYTFQWTVRKDHFSSRKLPAEMEDALKAFQDFFRSAFEKGTLENPIVKEGAFKSSDLNVDILLLWSRELYKDVFSWEGDNPRNFGEVPQEGADLKHDSKERRKAQKRAFQSWRFINHELAQIEKSFKNRLPKTSYHVITQDTSSDIQTRIKLLNENGSIPLNWDNSQSMAA